MNSWVLRDLNKSIKALFSKVSFLFFSLAVIPCAVGKVFGSDQNAPRQAKRLIVLSIDGFPGVYGSSNEIKRITPNLQNFLSKANSSFATETVNPSVTYPAHTSMVTGLDPWEHGIFNNTPMDPFDRNGQGWMWYAEDIQKKTLWQFAEEKGLSTANVFWPVTLGSKFTYNLPQYWRKKNSEDLKLLRAISTPGLHRELENKLGEPLQDSAKDELRFRIASYLLNQKTIDLIFIYTTDLDSAHHSSGVFSTKALQVLQAWDKAFGKFLEEIQFFEKDYGLVLVSDHGFFQGDAICSPNVHLANKGWIDSEKEEFDFWFKSSGGSAVLLPGKKSFLSISEESALALDLETNCPGTKYYPKSFLDQNFRMKQNPLALGAIYTSERIFLSGSRKGFLYQKSANPIFGHGYHSEISEMKTLLAVYPKTLADRESLRTVKDVFRIGCSFLQLNCK